MYIHRPTKGYPDNVEIIASEEGYGKNPYIETTKKLVVVTAPGPNSGKLGTCLSQLYHEYKKGVKAGYAKFETFPVWNLSLLDPVNIAYEAATVDLKDVNMIDPFHLEAYGEYSVNYNRDISSFPILKNILMKISGKEIYKSPTDMGVNMIKQCIINPEVVKKAATDEIIRRYYNTLCEYKQKLCGEDITNLSTDQIAKKGVFMSFQTPEEIPGISLAQFLKTTKHSITGEKPNLYKFTTEVEKTMTELNMKYEYVNREFNVGFSGGEKKKNEILQMLLLNPKLAILDETDSGLDVDAIKIVSRGINMYKNDDNAVLIITHNTKILENLKVDKVHVLVDGKIVKSGDSSLAREIEDNGYSKYIK